MADRRLGTMGFGYDDWAGPFYPKGLRREEWLAFYARHFDAVELDTTFHATPDVERVRRWAAAVPEDFRFSAKAPKTVTHELPLDKATEPMRAFLDVMREMGEKLSAVLLQFPPHFTAEHASRLDHFLASVPKDVPLAVELRNRTWGTQRTLAMLRSHRCALVAAEYQTRPRKLFITSDDLLYVRWIGEHGAFTTHAEERIDVSESLAWWKTELQRVATEVKSIHGFFNNDYAGYGIGTCNRFKAMLGLPVREPEGPAQGELFGAR
jgi:uncharacterized protein YecE (DUF72 family)